MPFRRAPNCATAPNPHPLARAKASVPSAAKQCQLSSRPESGSVIPERCRLHPQGTQVDVELAAVVDLIVEGVLQLLHAGSGVTATEGRELRGQLGLSDRPQSLLQG